MHAELAASRVEQLLMDLMMEIERLKKARPERRYLGERGGKREGVG
jgi:hypothetical protein